MGRRQFGGFFRSHASSRFNLILSNLSCPFTPHTLYMGLSIKYDTLLIIFKSILYSFINTVCLLLFLKDRCHNAVIGVSLLEMIRIWTKRKTKSFPIGNN